MKTNQFRTKSRTSQLALLALLFFFSGVLLTSCKRDNPVLTPTVNEPAPPAANLVPDEDETEYTMANYQDALDDVEYDGERLIFRNLSHFVTTAMALDSVGDSTAQLWFQGIGFTNSLYNEFDNALNNVPEDVDEAGLAQYFANNSNAVRYDANNDETWDVNAMGGTFARLLNTDHKAVIGENILYSNYDVNVIVGLADEDLIPTYSTQGFEQDDEYAIVQKNHLGLKTTASGGCLAAGFDIFIGDISCSDPAKRSKVNLHVWNMKYINGQVYSGATIKIKHQRRKLAVLWLPQSRGSQVGSVFEGVYFNQAKIYSASKSYHEYEVYKTPGNLPDLCWSAIQVCVAPMCNNQTMCADW